METVVSRSWRGDIRLTLFNLNTSFCDLSVCFPYRTLVRRALRRAPSAGLLAREDRTEVIIELRSMNIINGNEEVDRAISNGKLHALLHFHTRPINVVVSHGSDREHSFSGWFPA